MHTHYALSSVHCTITAYYFTLYRIVQAIDDTC